MQLANQETIEQGIVDNIDVLELLESVLAQIELSCSDIYRPGEYEIGSWVRHVVDFYRIFSEQVVLGSEDRTVDYSQRHLVGEEQRKKNISITREVSSGLESVREAVQTFRKFINEGVEDAPMHKIYKTEKGEVRNVFTTIGAELEWLYSHIVHHNALIFLRMRELGVEGVDFDRNFHFCPTTPEES